MLVCVHELVVEEQQPEGMHKLTFAMGQDSGGCCLLEKTSVCVLKRVRKLEQQSVLASHSCTAGRITEGMYAK